MQDHAEPTHGDTIQLLQRMAQGDADAGAEVWNRFYRDVHRIAHRAMRGEKAGHSLQATELIGLAFAKIQRLEGKHWQTREHFLRVVARAMYCVLVDHARRKRARPSTVPLPLDGALAAVEGRSLISLVHLDEALQKIEAFDPIMAEAFRLRTLGHQKEEIAQALGMSVRNLDRHWAPARAKLHSLLA